MASPLKIRVQKFFSNGLPSAETVAPQGDAPLLPIVAIVDIGSNSTRFARLALLHADGTVDQETLLPRADEGIARKGSVTALACPAPEQCWMAAGSGWLFHLGESLPRDEASAMHQLITSRPPDGSTPLLPPDTIPVDDSGAEPKPEAAEEALLKPRRKARPRPPLVARVKQRMASETVLELSFTLSSKARVQLLAKRRGAVVAKTSVAILGKGRHELRLRLDPRRWPTKFDLHAKPVGRRGK